MRSILILGAAGNVGTAAAEYLSQNSWQVRAFVPPWENSKRIEILKNVGCDIIKGDIRNANDLLLAMNQMNAVVNCAAAMPDVQDKKIQFEMNVLGSEKILRAASKAKVQQIIFISTAGVASHAKKNILCDESTPYRKPQNVHVWSKIEAEKRIDEVSCEVGLPSIILRPVSVYGKGVSFRWPQIFQMVKKGKAMLIDHGVCPYPLIHVEDVARAIYLSLEQLTHLTKNQKFILSSHESTTMADIFNYIADYYGVKRPKSLPFPLVLVGSCFVKCIPSFLKGERLKLVRPGTAVEYKYGHHYNTEHAKQLLGFETNIPFKEGMGEALKFYESVNYRN